MNLVFVAVVLFLAACAGIEKKGTTVEPPAMNIRCKNITWEDRVITHQFPPSPDKQWGLCHLEGGVGLIIYREISKEE